MTDFDYKQRPLTKDYTSGWDRVFMSNFEKAVNFTMSPSVEGGYSDDPKDKGNWTGGKIGVGELRGTKYGISAATFPQLIIKDLTWQEAKGIYKKLYWDACSCDLLTFPLSACVFDTAVNSGVWRAKKLLQDISNWSEYLNRRRDFIKSLASKRYERGWLARIDNLEKACKEWEM